MSNGVNMCSDCGATIDASPDKCPECGYDADHELKKAGVVFAGVGLFLMIFPMHWMLFYAGFGMIGVGLFFLLVSHPRVETS